MKPSVPQCGLNKPFHISFAHLDDRAQEMSSIVLLHSPPMRSNSPQRQKLSSPGDIITADFSAVYTPGFLKHDSVARLPQLCLFSK